MRIPHDLRVPGAPDRHLRSLEDILEAPDGLPPGAARGAAGPRVLRVAMFRVDFLQDSHGGATTGDGRFDVRTNTGVPVDPPPHNKAFFEAHGTALHHFYDTQSHGSLDLEITVLPPGSEAAFHLADTGDYGPWMVSQDADVIANAEAFVRAAIGAVAATNTVIFSDYDAFVVVHAGADLQGDVNDDTNEDIPTFTLDLADPIETPTGEVGRVLVLPETTSQDDLWGALNGVFAHEFGHILGLPDLYNICTGGSEVGYWSLMDSGENISAIVQDPGTGEEFEAHGIFPTSFDPWCKLQLFPDALQVQVVGESWDGTLEGAEVSPVLPLVPADPFEYFLVENRALDLDGNGFPFVVQDSLTSVFLGPADDPGKPGADGDKEWDAVLPGGGVFIWHIDDRIVLAALAGRGFENIPEAPPCARSAVNLAVRYRGVSFEEADGIWDLGVIPGYLGHPEDAFYDPNNTEFGPATVPSSETDLGAYSGITVQVTGAPDRRMGVTIRNTLAHDGWPVVLAETSTPSSTLPVDLDRDGAEEFLFAFRDEAPGVPTQNAIAGVTAFGEPYPDSSSGFAIVNTRLGRAMVTNADLGGAPSPIPGAGPLVATATVNGRLIVWGPEGGNPILSWNDEPVTSSPAFLTSDVVVCAGLGAFLEIDRTGTVLHRTPSVLASRTAIGTAGPVVLITPTDDACCLISVGLAFDGGENGGVLETYLPEESVPPQGVRLSENVRYLVAGPVLDADPWMVAATGDSVFVVRGAVIASRWALPLGESLTRPPALGDLDGDGREEWVAGTDAGRVLAYNADGSFVVGWPRALPPGSVRDVKIVDLDGDGRLDVLALDGSGLFWGFTGEGRTLHGYPRSLGPFTVTETWLTDLDGDGGLTYVAAATEGALVSLRFPEAVARVGDWRGPRGGGRAGWGTTGAHAPPHPVADRPELGDEQVIAFPNPSRGKDVEIRFTLGAGETADVKLLDLRGQVLSDPNLDFRGGPREGENSVVWRVGDTAPGLYLCRLHRGGGSGSRTDLVKIAIVQ